MAIGVGSLSPSVAGNTSGQGRAGQDPAGLPFGLRGSVSLGSGLRTGVTVVERAIQTSAELSDARSRARDALAEQARLEREAAQAGDAARREELQAESSGQAAEGQAAEGEADRQTIEAAVAAGESGEATPRGAFVDLSI